jgi:hypothetical protein
MATNYKSIISKVFHFLLALKLEDDKFNCFTRVLNWPTHAKKVQFTHELVK